MAFVIKDPPEFTVEIPQWTRETLADGVEMAKVPEQLLNNDVYLKHEIEWADGCRDIALYASDWSAAAPYVQTVNAYGITAADVPVIGIRIEDGITAGDVKLQNKAWGCVDRAVTGAGTITFYCYNKKPEADFMVNVKGAGTARSLRGASYNNMEFSMEPPGTGQNWGEPNHENIVNGKLTAQETPDLDTTFFAHIKK